MTATLLEEDRLLGSYVDAQHLEHVVAVHMYTVYFRHHWSQLHTLVMYFWVWLGIHTLFGACPLLRRSMFAHYLQSEAHALINQSSQKHYCNMNRFHGNHLALTSTTLPEITFYLDYTSSFTQFALLLPDCIRFSCCSWISPACDHHTHRAQI